MHNSYISEDAYYNKINKNPVYVVLMNGGTPLSKIISGFTGDTYTHACIAFNAKLKPLYSFGLTSESTFGFAVADTKDRKAFPHIDKYAVYVMYVSNHQLYKMKKILKWFMDNKDNLKFDFPALVSVFFQKDTENHTDKYFCSRFVSEILKIGEVDLQKKASLYRPESLLELSNISLVNWGRDILHYNWIKTRDNERLIKANKYVNPKNLIPKFESGGNDLYEETHWDTLLTKPKLYFNKKVTMYHYSNTNKDIVIPLTVNAGNKLAKPRFSSWWTPYKSNAGWALSYVIFNTFKESKWKDVLWHVETMTIDGMTYRAPRTIISESFYKSHEDFIKSIDVYEHQKTFNGSDLGRGNEYSVDEYTCDFAVKPDRVRRISWDEMLEIIKIVPDDEFQLYRKELNDMWVHGKTFQDLVHEKKPWLYWEMDVTKDIRARYCKEHNIQFKIDEEYFRFTYHCGGIYEALKQHVSPNVWRRLLTSSNFKWLPKPDYYSDTCTSWFTKEGKDQFVKKVLPICEKYLGDEIEYTKAKDLKNIVYKDRYQVVVDPVTNTNESVVYDDKEFYDILEEDSKHDYEKYNYGDKYVKNLRKVDILKSQLKKGKITQEQFDKEYAKLSSVKDEYGDEYTVPRSGTKKVKYNRPNKNKPDDSFKNIDHKGEDRSIYSGKVSDTNGEKFDHYNEILKRTENYNDYKTAFKNLTKLLGKPNACTIKVYHGSKNGKVNCECFDNKKPANCTSDTKLYHTTTVKGLTRLDGKFRGCEGFYFSSKRVYFHKDNPGGRQTNATGNYIPGPGEYVYEFIGNPSQAYVDPEIKGSAVFIETDTSVPVKDVTDQFRNKETKESVIYDDRDFDDILEEDSKYDYDSHLYGKEYARNLHKVDILKTRLKQGKITQEEFDKEYEKIKPSGRFKIKPSKDGAEKVEYKRPNKNKPEGSAKKLYKGENGSRVDGDLSKSDGEKFDHYNDILQRTENYNDYKTAFKNMARLLGKPNASAIKVDPDSFEGHVNARCYTSKKSANCTSDTKLYHTSETKGLTRLNGKFRSKDGICYSSKRVYFHKGKPGSRMGESPSIEKNEYVYEFIGNPSQAYVDPELNGTAVFIETDTSVPVKDVTDQFKNKEVKESADKSELTPNFKKKTGINFEIIDIHNIRAKKYLKSDKSLCKNMDFINKARTGEIAIDRRRDKLAGYIFVSKTGTIQPIHIYGNYRGYGLSETLLKDGIQKYHATNLGVYSDNEVAVNLYKKFGFKQTREKNYKDGEKVIFMELDDKSVKKESVLTESDLELNKSSNPLLNNIINFNAKTNVMEYIIPNNGNIISNIDCKAFLTKYRVLSPEKFKKYNGGICWDYVIYESYYFNKNFRNVPYKAFYHSFIDDRTDPAHTFILFYLSGKVYWFESSFKDLRGVYEFANESDALSYITRELYHVLDSNTRIRIRDSFLTTYNPVDTTTYNMTMEQYIDYMFTKPKYEYMKKNNPRYIRKYLGAEEFDIDQYHTESKSNRQLYFISDKNMDNKVLSPRIPDNYFTRHGYEDTKTKRVCFTPSIDKSLMALSNNITGKKFYVHVAIGDYKVYKPTVKQVPDSKITGELWVTKPVKVSCIGKIKVVSDMGLPGHKFSYGDKEAELYDWKWEWVEKLNSVTEACKNPREARRFVQDVAKLAKKYNANYFVVTDGASGTNNKDNKAVKYCRDALKEWERKNKFNPDEDWRKNPDDFSDYKLEETMLYEFANKELLDKIHVTSDVELSKWMKSNIKYQEFKKLMTPEEVFESRRGSCHDQVVFELAVLKALKYSPKTLFFIEYNDGETVGGQTHSLVYYRRGNNFFWFENAWSDQAGIHGPYKNVTEIKNDIISKHDTKKYKKLQFSSFRGKAGMTLDELVKACLK